MEFIDTTSNNAPASNISNIPDISAIDVNFIISSFSAADAKCNFYINGTASANSDVNTIDINTYFKKNFQSNIMEYSIMVAIVCVIHLFASIKVIKNISENEPDGKKVKIIT